MYYQVLWILGGEMGKNEKNKTISDFLVAAVFNNQYTDLFTEKETSSLGGAVADYRQESAGC